MSRTSDHLAPALRDLQEALDDLRRSSVETVQYRLEHFTHHLDTEPMRGFLAALPIVDFESWLPAANANTYDAVLAWPRDRPSSVAMRVAYARAMAIRRVLLLDVIGMHFRKRGENNVLRALSNFVDDFAQPLLRDIKRLAEERPLPPGLQDLIGNVPASGDDIFDGLVRAALESFRDNAPAARAIALRTLWDGWERLKTLEERQTKKLSLHGLLDQAASEPTFRAVLEAEAGALTKIGNAFHIRHLETDRVPIERPELVEYLFHRLLALMNLLLIARSRPSY
jgi:hypothetical protein